MLEATGGLGFELRLFLGVVYDQGKREGEGSEREAGQGRGNRLVDAGGAWAREDGLKGERRRRGPTA